MKVGFIGLGAMGRPMAANLQRAGHDIQAHDLRRIEGFANWKESAADAARGCEVLFTSLPGPKEVLDTKRKIESALPSGATWFDLSTNSPEVVRRLQRELHAIIGDQPYYVGPIGAGTVAKLAHNLASFAVQAALAEVFTLGVKAGVEPLALFRALRQGATGRKRTFDRLAEKFLPGDYEPASFALRLAHKDVSLAVELAQRQGVPLKVGKIALDELTEAMNRGWGERDCRVAMTLQEERAGVSVRVPPEDLSAALKE
ncbi:MAG: NAD(P)-dependent oxidoreductase [Betaproteobacteria bacterium]|nr:MAG: NAD(P)-dependent oxidoreductase [Betaproteobacteria bacterium]